MRQPTLASLLIIVVAAVLGCGPDPIEQRVITLQQNVVSLQHELHGERNRLDSARDQLRVDRENWNSRQRSDHLVASAIGSAALLIVCVSPLMICVLLLWPRSESPSDEVSELILDRQTPPPALPPAVLSRARSLMIGRDR